jgi:serine/threonine-protein kinase
LVTAREAAEEALRLNPSLPAAHLAMGRYWYVCCPEYERAVEHLRRTTHFGEGLLHLANVHKRQGRWQEALQAFDQASLLEPHVAWVPHNSAQVYMWLRQFEDLERVVDRMRAIDPQMALWPYEAWISLLRDGDTGKAREYLQRAAWRTGRDSVFSSMNCRVAIFDRRYEDAIKWASRGNGARPPFLASEVQNHIAKAAIYRLMEEGALARTHYDSARVAALRDLQPGMQNKRLECDLRAHLAIAYAGLGLRDRALSEAEALVGLDPLGVDAWWGSNWLLDLAEMNVLLGEHNSAIDLLEQVLSMPSRLTAPILELDPLWDPLRDHPRFQALLTLEP